MAHFVTTDPLCETAKRKLHHEHDFFQESYWIFFNLNPSKKHGENDFHL